MPDQFSMSGDFRGALINIKSTLTHVQQSVGDISTKDQSARAELETLIKQLGEALEKIPVEKHEDAQAVADMAKVLVDTAKTEKPNKTMLNLTGEGLKNAAQNLKDIAPIVLSLAAQIVITITKLVGNP